MIEKKNTVIAFTEVLLGICFYALTAIEEFETDLPKFEDRSEIEEVKSIISTAKSDYRKLLDEFKEDQRVAAQKGNSSPWTK